MITIHWQGSFKRGKETKTLHPKFVGETLDAVSHDLTDFVMVQEEHGWELSENHIESISLKGVGSDLPDFDSDDSDVYWRI